MSPSTSSFFSNITGYSGEDDLVDSLVIEQIAIYGVDVMYMPRKMINFDRFLNESTKSIFEVSLSIPMYIKSYSGYNNGMELLTKFGVRASDELTLVMSKTQFQACFAPYLNSYYQSINGNSDELNELLGQTEYRPKEGDLVYFPFDGGIFEIKYVNVDGEFFQLGKNRVFELTLEKFEYSGEVFDTGLDDVDNQQANTQYYRMEFTVAPTGVSTFEIFEKVKIYNNIPPVVIGPQGPQGAQDFNLYGESGFLVDVPYVTGTVLKWDKPENKLVIGDISNQDPTQRDEDLNTNIDKLKNVIIVGEISGAIYTTTDAGTEETAFNDSIPIQQEFDQIKIIDPGDSELFGFF